MSPHFPSPAVQPSTRRIVLGAALVAAIVVAAAARHPDDAVVPQPPLDVALVAPAFAADVPPAPARPQPPPPPRPSAGPSTTTPAAPPAAEAPAKDAEAAEAIRSGAEITIDEKGIRIEKPGSEGRRSRNITIQSKIDGDLGDLGDLGPFKQTPRWVGPLAFLSVALFFLVPLAAIALVVWYKMRRARMLNEVLLRYAEKGISPPPEALQALGGAAAAAAALQAASPDSPAYEQAKAVRRGVAWSDLRKGVVLGAIGLAFVVFSMMDDGSPNWFGLVLLFLGVGYGVLWYMEERQGRGAPGVPPGGA